MLHNYPWPTDIAVIIISMKLIFQRLPQAMLAVYRSCGQQIINFQANLSGLFASKLA